MEPGQKPVFFETAAAFRQWLDKNHHKAADLLVGFYKTGSGKKSMTWSESVDQAICYGWIDGVRKSIDDESYFIRFCPRKPKSIWSAINIKKVEDLIKAGLMTPAGTAAFSKREESRSAIYTYERKEEIRFSEEYAARFNANKKAWKYFESAAPSYIKQATHWVMSAKQEATREKRLQELISDSEAGRRLKQYRW
ncbi:MAG TPA: YdeI/OmpD-associated family protein [Chitinophaga sp.]|uniref:YdeI/OmpD-associated family protein n=1 Tax=Chitinophaga sp. TaxID=1869181 RepID=UPI002C669D23|nr:YdeI/OmpD-associated family protein [Chitinophaga sp.]HVI47481.1 YdeI/OmpD-associated family protein [Chitinophaga sp.]